MTIHLVLGARISHGAGYMNPKQHLRSQHLPGGKYTYIYIYIVNKYIYIFLLYIYIYVCVYTELHNTSCKKLHCERKLIF